MIASRHRDRLTRFLIAASSLIVAAGFFAPLPAAALGCIWQGPTPNTAFPSGPTYESGCYKTDQECITAHGSSCSCKPDAECPDTAAAPVVTSKPHDETFVPKLQINIPDVQFTSIKVNTDAGFITIPWIGQYVSGIYSYAVGVAGILAGVMFVVGGFQILTAGGDATRYGKGKQRITDALVGLFLTFGAYLILNTVSPQLTAFDALKVRTVSRETFSAEEAEDFGDTTAPPTGTAPSTGPATALCRTLDTCRDLCAKPRDEWPATTPGMMDPSLAVTIPDLPGLQGGGQTASQAVVEGLTRAATDAHGQGYIIRVTSGYRSLSKQIQLVCARLGIPDKEAGIGHAVAWPGGSNHGAGSAVDVQLIRASDNALLVGSGDCAAQSSGTLATPANSSLLDQIMSRAGAKRYANEIWHYEFGGATTSCRCSYPNCPPPPKACSGGCG